MNKKVGEVQKVVFHSILCCFRMNVLKNEKVDQISMFLLHDGLNISKRKDDQKKDALNQNDVERLSWLKEISNNEDVRISTHD